MTDRLPTDGLSERQAVLLQYTSAAAKQTDSLFHVTSQPVIHQALLQPGYGASGSAPTRWGSPALDKPIAETGFSYWRGEDCLKLAIRTVSSAAAQV